MNPADCKSDVYFDGNILCGLFVWGGDCLIKKEHRLWQDKATLQTQSSSYLEHVCHLVFRASITFCQSSGRSGCFISGVLQFYALWLRSFLECWGNRGRYYFWVTPKHKPKIQTLALITHSHLLKDCSILVLKFIFHKIQFNQNVLSSGNAWSPQLSRLNSLFPWMIVIKTLNRINMNLQEILRNS